MQIFPEYIREHRKVSSTAIAYPITWVVPNDQGESVAN